MAVPSSGPLQLYGDIGTELGVAQSNVSLHGMSQTAGFTTPDEMSEFYGYSGSTSSTTAWLASDDLGNLFYTQDETGLTGWTNAGVNLTGYVQDAVYTGQSWLAATDYGLWQTNDTTGTSGWSKKVGGNTTIRSISWTSSGIVVCGDDANVYYTTDASGASGWANFPNINSSTAASYLGVANDGSQTFFAIRNQALTTQEYAYANDLFGSSSVTYQNAGISSNFARAVFYDPVNNYYFVGGADSNLEYQTTLGGGFTSVSAGGGSVGYSLMTYNGTYYVINTPDLNGYAYSTNSTSGYSSVNVQSAQGWDRNTAAWWNGTAWGAGGRYASGDKVFAFRNNLNPGGTWTGVSKPSGFNGNRCVAMIPSKRPYYNAITNLGF